MSQAVSISNRRFREKNPKKYGFENESIILCRQADEGGYMSEIPLGAEVECLDGPCGKTISIIINPTNKSVTHVVVRDKTLDDDERLVPIEHLGETTEKRVQLNIRRDEMARMEPFVKTRYLKTKNIDFMESYIGHDFDFYLMPYATPMKTEYIPIDEEQIPPGELAVYRGARVEATDGKAGMLGEFLVNPLTGHISHLILMEGHLWGKKEVTIPVSAIDRIEEDTVYLKLDKKAVESLPPEPVRRHW
jgi:sporulation protein YlmC with PRC-barrel domain